MKYTERAMRMAGLKIEEELFELERNSDQRTKLVCVNGLRQGQRSNLESNIASS